MKIRLKDFNFSHAYTIGNGDLFIKPKDFSWDRTDNYQDITIFTDRCLNQINDISNKSKINIAAIFEPPVINSNSYNFIICNYKLFDIVLTYNKNILNNNDNFKFCPHGGCWLKKTEQKIYKKTKNISVIFSNKNRTEGHKLRHNIIDNFSNKIDFIAGNVYNKIESKLEALKDFKFHIVVENCLMDYYFSEKLIDCFVTGTIPIFWGCPSIGKFFDLDGMLCFYSMDELNNILNNISESYYESKLKYIKRNFELSKKYIIVEDYIYDNIIKKLIKK